MNDLLRRRRREDAALAFIAVVLVALAMVVARYTAARDVGPHGEPLAPGVVQTYVQLDDGRIVPCVRDYYGVIDCDWEDTR